MTTTKLKYTIKNSGQLRTVIKAEIEKALEKISDKAMGDLDDIIMKDVYLNDYFPNIRYYGGSFYDEEVLRGTYEPTWQFREAWKKTISSESEKTSLSIFYDPNYIEKDAHKSILNDRDISQWLDRILNVDGYTSELEFGRPPGTLDANDPGTLRHVSKLRKPYWDNFLVKMVREGKIREWLKQELKSQGLDVR